MTTGGKSQPVYVVTDAEIAAGKFTVLPGPAHRVASLATTTRGVTGGASTPVYAISAAEAEIRGVIGGKPIPVGDVTSTRPVSGSHVALPVYVVSGTLGGGGSTPPVSTITYLLRDQFLTNDNSPITSPRTCEPGPGSATAFVNDGSFAIADGALVYTTQSTPAWGDEDLVFDSLTRATGRAICFSTRQAFTNKFTSFGLFTGALGTDANREYRLYFDNAATYDLYVGSTIVKTNIDTYDTGLRYYAMILRTSGVLVAMKPDGGSWSLLWPENTRTTATLYPVFANWSGSGWLYEFSTVDLPAPFTDDDGVCTTTAATVADTDTFAHDADGFIEFTLTTKPGAGTNVEMHFRMSPTTGTDDSWMLDIDVGTGLYFLTKVVGGTPAIQDANNTPADGDTVQISCHGTLIKVYINGALSMSVTSADNQTNAGGGQRVGANSAVISDLKTYPRALPTAATDVLDSVFS